MILTSPVDELIVATDVLLLVKVNEPLLSLTGAATVKSAEPYVRSATVSAPRVGAPFATVSVADTAPDLKFAPSGWDAEMTVVPGPTTVIFPVAGSTVATDLSLLLNVNAAGLELFGKVTDCADTAVVSSAGSVNDPYDGVAFAMFRVTLSAAASSVVVCACSARTVALPADLITALPVVASTSSTDTSLLLNVHAPELLDVGAGILKSASPIMTAVFEALILQQNMHNALRMKN